MARGSGRLLPWPVSTFPTCIPIPLLQVADAVAARDELAARGVAIAEEPERKPWGLIEFSVVDPDGLELVVVETPIDHPLRRRD